MFFFCFASSFPVFSFSLVFFFRRLKVSPSVEPISVRSTPCVYHVALSIASTTLLLQQARIKQTLRYKYFLLLFSRSAPLPAKVKKKEKNTYRNTILL